MPIAAGELNARITLYPVTSSRGDGGEDVQTLGTGVPLWAKVEPGFGGEGVRGDGQLNRQPTRFTIRSRSGVGPTYRIGYKGRMYEIEDVAEPFEGQNEYVVITAYADEASE